MESNCHVCIGGPSCLLDMLDLLKKQKRKSVGSPKLTTVIETSFFEDVHLNWLSWFHFPILMVCSLIILIDCIFFNVARCCKDAYAYSFFVTGCTAGVFNCRIFFSDLNDFKSIVRYLLSLDYYLFFP